MALNRNISLILHFLFLLGLNNVKPNTTNEKPFITGPLQNESRRFLWQDPLSKDWHHCLFCVDKALSNSVYLYMQQPLCLANYDEKFSQLTQYEKDEKKYAFCGGKGHGEVPGCGEPQIHDNATWTCDPGLSHTNYSVYYSCYLTCDYNGEVMSKIYCNATLQWEVMMEANMSTCVPIPIPTSPSTPSHPTKHKDNNGMLMYIGIGVGALVVICIFLVCVVCIIKKKSEFTKSRRADGLTNISSGVSLQLLDGDKSKM